MNQPWLNTHLQQLHARFKANRLHHGLLFSGVQGVGKTQLAETLSHGLLCKNQVTGGCGECQSCQLLKAGSHPDFHHIKREKSQISVDQIRQGISVLNKTSQLGGPKVLIIHQAEWLNQASANALLKTLEEPASQTYLILITSQSHRLLPTILSRCEKRHIATPEQNEALDWLQQQGHSASAQLLQLCDGAPYKVIQWQADGIDSLSTEVFEKLDAMQEGLYSPVSLAETWQEHAELVCGFIQSWSHQRCQSATSQSEQEWRLYQSSLQIRRQIQHPGVNKTLLLTELLERIAAY